MITIYVKLIFHRKKLDLLSNQMNPLIENKWGNFYLDQDDFKFNLYHCLP